ncbi:hypothetical protein GH741_14720 [Aquibacillus halophilus]|uniref:Uncharacterized protein n=1 Tax=Aquibacillus halophilus TaxID=930132 RepID=A0A6A8DEA7_9BACI|nr:hypothetical protein [Aquibacillus halophilus]MRH43894.1 hypothetical protein [Aquibacillus halophilus]
MKLIVYISLCLFIGILGALVLTNNFPSHLNSFDNPTAGDILDGNPDADILKLDGLIYLNSTSSEWLETNTYTRGEKIGQIKKRTTNTWFYRNLFATKLPKGTNVYTSNGDQYSSGDAPFIVIVDLNNQELIYHSLIEG